MTYYSACKLSAPCTSTQPQKKKLSTGDFRTKVKFLVKWLFSTKREKRRTNEREHVWRKEKNYKARVELIAFIFRGGITPAIRSNHLAAKIRKWKWKKKSRKERIRYIHVGRYIEIGRYVKKKEYPSRATSCVDMFSGYYAYNNSDRRYTLVQNRGYFLRFFSPSGLLSTLASKYINERGVLKMYDCKKVLTGGDFLFDVLGFVMYSRTWSA